MTGGSDLERRTRLEEVVAEVLEPVRRYLVRRTDRDTAEDVLADTLLVCWRRLDDVPDDPLPWAYGVARHALGNVERGVRRQRRLAARISVVDPPTAVEPTAPDADPRVGAVLAGLRPEDAELLRLWSWEQLAPSEIAVVLGITPNAVSIRLHRAREKFREAWRKIDDPSGHEPAIEGRAP